MKSERLHRLALDRYAAALRAGTATPYECLRYLEQRDSHGHSDREDLRYLAAVALVRHDPLFVATSVFGIGLESLTAADIDACIAAWTIDDDTLRGYLEAHLRLAVRALRLDREQLELALAALERARPAYAGEVEFLELRAEALEHHDDERYPPAIDAVIAATDPEWRAHPLRKAMSHAVALEHWLRYDALRARWAELPRNALCCECHTNFVADIDGLRALARGDVDEALRCLDAAVSVGGCPHLNSGGASLRLARELLDRRIALPQVAEHVRKAAQYRVTDRTRALTRELAERLG